MNRICVTGTHSSAKGWIVGILYHIGFKDVLHEPFNPFCPPGIAPGDADLAYLYCDELSPVAKKMDLSHRFNSWHALTLPSGGGYRDRISSFKNTLRRAYLLRTSGRLAIKDPFALFVARFLRIEHNIFPWIIIRHPADFVANSIRNNIPFYFQSFLKDGEFAERLGDRFETLKREAIKKENSNIFHQNIFYWLVCSWIALDFVHTPPIDNGWHISLLDEINIDPELEIKTALKYLGIDGEYSLSCEIITDSKVPSKNLTHLQQNAEMLTSPRKVDKFSCLSDEMILEIDRLTRQSYENLLEVTDRRRNLIF